jgi:hypothetical protein
METLSSSYVSLLADIEWKQGPSLGQNLEDVLHHSANEPTLMIFRTIVPTGRHLWCGRHRSDGLRRDLN